MNIMISSILDIGRTEGAQFEQTTDLFSWIYEEKAMIIRCYAQKNIIITFFSNVNQLTLQFN